MASTYSRTINALAVVVALLAGSPPIRGLSSEGKTTSIVVSCTNYGASAYERTFSVDPNGYIEGSSPKIAFTTIVRLIERRPIALDAGLRQLLAQDVLRASETEAFRHYAAVAWYGIWTPQQEEAFSAAYLSPELHMKEALRIYASPDALWPHDNYHCLVKVSTSMPLLPSIEVHLHPVPFSMPLYIVKDGERLPTYNADLARAIATLFPRSDFVELDGKQWTSFLATTAAMTLSPAINKPSVKPQELLAQSPSPVNRFTYVGLDLDDRQNVRWIMTLPSLVVTNLASIVFGHIVSNKLVVSEDDIAAAQRRLMTVERMDWLTKKVGENGRATVYPITYYGNGLAEENFLSDAARFHFSCADAHCVDDALVVEVLDANRHFYDLVLLPDGELVFWKYLQSPPDWLKAGNVKDCDNGMHCDIEPVGK